MVQRTPRGDQVGDPPHPAAPEEVREMRPELALPQGGVRAVAQGGKAGWEGEVWPLSRRLSLR